MNTVLKISAIVVATMLLAHTVTAQRGRVTTWKVDGESRQAIVFAPPEGDIGRVPVVFAFHGHGDDMYNFQGTNLHRAWPEALVVYFQGLPTPRSGLPGWQTEKGEDHDRDLRLVDTALASLRGNFAVDPSRIYAAGFSNGAGLTYLLWAERPAVFAAYAAVAGRMRPSVQPAKPRPIFHVVGLRESVVPFASQQESIEAAKKVNAAGGTPSSCGDGCELFGARSAAPVMTWVHPGGHTWPPATSERIATFFRARRLIP
jgi:polyhydroxybutyrate depolymerase